MGDGAARQESRQQKSNSGSGARDKPAAPAAPDPVKEGINVIRGIFGR
jgi:hypothetical protein